MDAIERKQNLLIFFGILVLFSLIYLPVLQGYYAYHDDYYFWYGDKSASCNNIALFNVAINMGRQIAAYIYCVTWHFVNTFDDIRIIRFVNIFLISLIAFWTYLGLNKNQISKSHSFLLTVMIFTLPTFQSDSTYAVSISSLIACLLSGSAALIAYKALYNCRTAKLKITLILISIGLLLISLHIHQGSILFYWPIIAIPLLRIDIKSWKQSRLPLIYLFCINLFANLIYFYLYIKFYATPYAKHYTGELSRIISAEKIIWFFQKPLLDALNLWNIFPKESIAFFVSVLIVSGLIIEIITVIRERYESGSNKLLFILLKNLLIISLLPLSQLPYLIAQNNLSFYRGLKGLSPLIVILLFFSVSNFFRLIPDDIGKKLITGLLVIGSLTGMYYAHNNVMNYVVIPQTVELRYIKSLLQQSDLSKVKQIHIIHFEGSVPLYGEAIRYDEFGLSAMSLEVDVPQIVKAALTEIGKEYILDDIVVTESISGEPADAYYDPSAILIIDMRPFRYFY